MPPPSRPSPGGALTAGGSPGGRGGASLGGAADLFLVVAKTSKEPGHKDIAMFAVEREGGGVTFSEPYRKAGAPFLPIGEMVLDGAPGRVLAPPGQGLRAALGAIDLARCAIAALANGLPAEAPGRPLG